MPFTPGDFAKLNRDQVQTAAKAGPDKTGEDEQNLCNHESETAAQRHAAAAKPAGVWTAAALKHPHRPAGAHQRLARYGAKLQTLSLPIHPLHLVHTMTVFQTSLGPVQINTFCCLHLTCNSFPPLSFLFPKHLYYLSFSDRFVHIFSSFSFVHPV